MAKGREVTSFSAPGSVKRRWQKGCTVMIDSIATDGKSEFSHIPENPKLLFLLDCLARGWHIFRMRPIVQLADGRPACTCKDGPTCDVIGKHPAVLWTKPIDPKWKGAVNYVTAWLAAKPDAGWGIHLGLSGLVAVDIDPKNGGLASLDQWRQRGLLADMQPTVFTGSGGFHFFFQAPQGADPIKGWRGPNGEFSTSFKPAPGIDVFAGQHLLVLPFSPHKSGRTYQPAPTILPGSCPENICAEINAQPKFVERARPAHSFAVPSVKASAADHDHAMAACWAYVLTMDPPTHDGTHSRKAGRVARLATIDFGLSRADAKVILQRWDSLCGTPIPDKQIERILDYGEKGFGTRGWRLNVPGGGAERAAAEKFAKVGSLNMSFGNWRINPITEEVERVEDEISIVPEAEKITEDLGGIDAVPGPSFPTLEKVAPPEKLYCQHRCTVCLRHLRTKRKRLQRFPCRRLICPACFIGKKDDYKSTISCHFLRHYVALGKNDDASLFVAYIPVADWGRVGRRIRAAHGEYFRVDLHAQGYEAGPAFLVVSTVAVGKAEWEEVPLLDAQALLHSAIDNLTTKLRKRVFWSSRAWKIVDDTPEMPVEWERVHSIKCSPTAQRAVLDHHEIDYEPVYGGGQVWGWQADEFSCEDERWEIVQADLEAGCILGLDWDTGDDATFQVGGPSSAEEQTFLSG